MKNTLYIMSLLIIGCFLGSALSSPIQEKRKLTSFLFKFGYIAEVDSRGTDDLNSPEMKASIRRLQRFGRIRVTGEMDTATTRLINTDRCGVRDPQNTASTGRFSLQGSTWKKRNLTYRILNFTRDGIPYRDQRRIFRKAFSLWESSSGLTIREVYFGNADILISFVRQRHGDDFPFDREGGTLAHAFYPLSNRGLSGDAHFDDDERFTTGTSDGINLDWVAVHEFGHSLGLEHSNVRESIMYPWYKGYLPNIQLTDDDIKGIQALYPKPTVQTFTPPKVKTTPKVATAIRPSRVTRQSTNRPRVTPKPSLPIPCGSSIRYDTVFVGPSGWTFFFVEDSFWQLDRRLNRYGPRAIQRYWKGLKTPVDAAYLNKRRNMVFFTGSEFWEYDSRRNLINSGSITQYGLPQNLANMDAVFRWEGNGKTYFFKGNKYWKYDDQRRRIQTYYYDRINRKYLRYPRDIKNVWKFDGNIKAAVKWRNDRNYVFWDTRYIKLQKGKVVRERGYPQVIADRWMKCNNKGRENGANIP
ncbi:matrix metalloproteinase-24-like [Montipora capricornis]|uniref:matrix metalloproteinase-24-like n=1 Tax=Montipora capricornis TaxID=246305 RepID=UPI0035F1BAA6